MLLTVLVAAVGAASARADGSGTTTTGTTTAATTTATTTAPSYAPLASSSLPAGCVGAGTAALVLPSQRVIALGTPAANLGPSAYPSSGSALAFDSSAASGASCSSAGVTLSSVSLFGGIVTASGVTATDGRGTVANLAVDGSTVSAAAGETVPVEGWGQLTLGATLGRVTGPLVLRLLQARGSLPAGTAIVLAFAASARPTAKPLPAQQTQPHTHQKHATGSSRSREQRRQAQRPPPDFPATAYPITVTGGLTAAARDNPVVSLAMRYLGVRYQWGGASPATGFDCSGLVMYVFGKLGVALPHFAASQYYSPDAVWVAPSRLQPGDLVFFTGSDGTRKEPGHVGIYVDDGYIIDAPHTGSSVRIDRLTEPKLANQYVGAKRIVSQLLDVRQLSHSESRTAFATALLRGVPSPVAIETLGDSLGVAAAGSVDVRTAPPDRMWAGVVVGGAILLLSAGGLALRRRRTSGAGPAPDSSN
jgi:cell wall-associated NlpC family hydrolase